MDKYSYLKTDTLVVQEYIQHHFQTLIKIYAVGNKFDTVQKKTFPETTVENAFEAEGFLKIGQKNNFEEEFDREKLREIEEMNHP